VVGPYFCDIPVYRLKEDRYYQEMGSFIEKQMYPGPPEQDAMNRDFYSKNPDQEVSFRDHLRLQFGGAWPYNEIIGYIQLHFLGTRIRGEYWQVKAKRIQRTRRKMFEWRTWKLAAETEIPGEATSPEIFALVLEYLDDCAKELKGRYIDASRLKTIGPYVDWRALLRNA
jgi:hypothetical protein